MFPVLYITSLKHLFYNFIPSSLYLLIPSPILPSHSGNHWSVLYVCEFVTVLLHLFTCFIFLDCIYEWKHPVFDFVCLTYLTKHNIF